MINKKQSPIKTGLCAYGMSGRVFHAPFLDCMEGFELSAVTERHARKAVQQYSEIHTFRSVEEMLKDEELELIVVNTPNVLHYSHAKQALQSGKHVIIEKPFSATLEQAKELIRIAADKNLMLVAFQNRRWDSDFQSVQQIVNEGKLGELIEASFHYERYKIESNAKKHKEKPEKGVGLIYDLGPHLIDQAIHLFGKPEAVFARVQANRPGSLVDDYFMIHLLYSDFNCALHASLLVREPMPAFILHGTKGSFIKTRADVQEAKLNQGNSPCVSDWGQESASEKGLLHTQQNEREIRRHIESPKGCYQEFYQQIFECLRANNTSPISLKDTLLNMRIIEAALKSQKELAVISLD